MAVMQVRPMRMRMRHRLMTVRMAMPERGVLTLVHMRVMSIVVPMPMVVLHLLVHMFVSMPFPQEEEDERYHKQSRGTNL